MTARTFSLCLILARMILAVPLIAQDVEPKETADIFRVSKAGGDAEKRDQLISIYGLVSEQFNQQAAREFAEQKAVYAGQRVRVIEKLEKKDDHGELYLAAYQGEPCVFSISEGDFKKGDTTPPLEIVESGNYETEVTRLVDDTGGAGEVKTEEQGGLVEFFGVVLDFGDGPVKARPKKEVTTTETLKKFEANLSTQVLSAPVKMNKDIFLNSLKNGETYEVTQMEERRCQTCRGFGRVPNDGSAPRQSDGKMNCRDCMGKGKLSWKVHYLVAW